MAFNRICTSVYRIYVICMAFGRMPCGKHHMLGFHPQSPERGRPRRHFEHGITFYLNLYVNLPCPREMGNAHFSNVRPVSAKYSKTYKLSADFKCSSERKSCPNTPQFKRFWRFQGPFFKRFLSPFPPFPLPPRSGFRSGGGSIRGNISIPRYAVCGRDRRSTAAAVLSLSVPPYL